MSSIRKIKSMKYASNKQINERLLDESDPASAAMGTDEQPQSFMSFTPKVKRASTNVQRRYTQKKQPPNINTFMSEFEQESRPPIPTITREDSINSSKSLNSYGETEEIEDFSDTARLTANASSMSGFHDNRIHLNVNQEEEDYRPHRASFASDRKKSIAYEPAFIDPKLDERKRRLNRIIHYDKRSALEKFSRVIRRISKRVMNVHDNNSDSISPQPQSAHYTRAMQNSSTTEQAMDPDLDTSSLVTNESIPMQQSISNKSSTANGSFTPYSVASNTTTSSIKPTLYYINPDHKDTKEYIQLRGNSLKLFSPTNPLRTFLANIICLK